MRRASATSLTAGRVIALLRAVNVGGRSLKMEDLRQILHRLGYVEPRTLLQSGNAVFGFVANTPVRTAASVEAQIEEALQKRLSLQSDWPFVAPQRAWTRIEFEYAERHAIGHRQVSYLPPQSRRQRRPPTKPVAILCTRQFQSAKIM